MQHQTVPQTTGVIATIRSLLAAGWRNDSVHQMANGDTVRTMLHPTGREITTSTGAHDVDTKLTLTGLTLDQVAGAINGAGLAPTEPTELPRADQPEPDLRYRLAAELHRIADDIVNQRLPLGHYPALRFGVVDSRTDLDQWADYLGTTIDAPDSTGIPSVTTRIQLGDTRYGPELAIGVQSPKEQSELERLRAENARLQAQLAEGGADR